MAVGADGSLYIADEPNNRVQKLTAPSIGPRELTGPWRQASGIDGSIARLYMAVFARQPDTGGHAYWVAQSNAGLSLNPIADFFVNSPEFVATYNTLDNAGFVDLLYRNVLTRMGETAGVQYWNAQLANGVPRATVVLMFSESAEFKALTRSS